MAKRNSSNQDYTNNADGWDLSGGTTPRKLTLSGGDVAIAGSGSAVITFPTSTSTLATLALSETLSSKTLTSPVINTGTVGTSLLPTSNDGAAIGASGTAFSDFFLASGGVINWAAGNATLTHSTGLLTSNVPLSLGTSNALTAGTIELGHASDTTLTRSAAGTLAVEGIRVQTTTPLVVSAASYTTDTGTSLNMDNLDMFVITAQAGALLFNSPGGTLVQGRKLMIRIKDNGTARALTWNSVFRSMGTALPSTTVLSKTLYLGFIYNSTDTKWDLVASAQEA